MKMKKRSSGGGANWMDTYGDMVTLLLCFFVLLYSMSTIDSEKWKSIVQSFNPNAMRTQSVTPGGEGPNADIDEGQGGPIPTPEQELTPEEQQAEVDAAIDALYEALKQYAEESEAGANIEVTKGDSYVFVSFNDAVFFDGNSYVLREDGEGVLTSVAEILDKAAPYIDEIRVMGHTAQAEDNTPNNPYKDRMLSSQRATVATWYIQEHARGLDPARIVSVGYGQHRPVAPNDSEHRYQNRRVEIVVTGFNLLDELGDSIEQYESIRTGTAGSSAQGEAPAPVQSPQE